MIQSQHQHQVHQDKMITHTFPPSYWLGMIVYGRKEVLPNDTTVLSTKNRSYVCKKKQMW